MLKANSESELLNILKIISEESVRKSRRMLKEEADPAQKNYIDGLSKSESNYGVSLSEQEEDEEKPEETPEQEEEQQSGEEDALGDTDEFGVSFDSVLKDINTLRSGRSTKDKEIKEELLEYYDRLDEDERIILHIFLRELSKILRGAIDGSEALDPSDAPLYADIVLGKEKEDKGKKEPQKSKPAKASKTGEEDVTPPTSNPIQVNEVQNLQEVRKKFRRLLKRLWF